MMSRLLGQALGSVVSPIIEYVDVEGVVRRVDVDSVVQRIDVNALLERVDFDALLSRIDINEQMERIDMDAVMNRIDFDNIIRRSNLDAIIARSSSSFLSGIWDRLRTILVQMDQRCQRLGRCACCAKQNRLPPRPGEKRGEMDSTYPKDSTAQLAVQIQGRYAGLVARVMAFLIDFGIVWLTFTLTVLLVTALVRVFVTEEDQPQWTSTDQEWQYVPIAYFVWAYLYSAVQISLVGATIGMACLGLQVVNSNGSPIGSLQAFWRQAMIGVSVCSIVGVLMGWIRRDGRMLHDLLSCTGLIYSWDARMAQIRAEAQAMPRLEHSD
jgi:uncharacterized RDD family membrane protein YckC